MLESTLLIVVGRILQQDIQSISSNLSESETPRMPPLTSHRAQFPVEASSAAADGMSLDAPPPMPHKKGCPPTPHKKIFLREQDLSQFDAQLIAQYGHVHSPPKPSTTNPETLKP